MERSTREPSTSNNKKFSTYYSMPCAPSGIGMCEIQKYLTAYTLYSPILDKCVVLYLHYESKGSYYDKVGYSIFVGDKPSDDVLKDIRTEEPTYYDDIDKIDKMIQMTNCFFPYKKLLKLWLRKKTINYTQKEVWDMNFPKIMKNVCLFRSPIQQLNK